MSDEDERPMSINSPRPTNERRLIEIRSRLHTLTREKTKYNVDKLNQDAQFLRGEIEHLSRAIREINETIRTQIRQRRTLDVERANYKSHSRVHYSNLEAALKEEERLKIELEKKNKTDAYRDLVAQKLSTIANEKPTLKTLEDYRARLRAMDEAQQTAQKKRETFEENLRKNLERQNEIRTLLRDSEERLPNIEKEIESLRNERDTISSNGNSNRKQRRNRLEHLQEKYLDSPDLSSKSLVEQTLEWERNFHEDRLEKVRQLRKYFLDQLAERNLPLESPATDLISPFYQSLICPNEILNETLTNSETTTASTAATSMTTTTMMNSSMPVAIRLPRNFLPLPLMPLSPSNNEIIHSPHCNDASIEYKKELPSDIVDRYAGITKKNKPTTPLQFNTNNFGKKNKKNRKHSAMKHTAHIISLYNEIRGNDVDLLPSMPMVESELTSTIKSLEIIEQSVQSFLNEFSQRTILDEFPENESIRDSALDTFSETSSIVETSSREKTLNSNSNSNSNRIEQRSTSSSDEKKTIVSSSSVTSSNHSDSKTQDRLTTVDETVGTNQIDRQISDEGYRSVRNDQQQQQFPLITETISTPNFDPTEKVDLWLSKSPINTNSDQRFILIPESIEGFQGTEGDADEERNIEN